MNVVELLSAQPWVERLGWTLLHFLWEGALVGAVYAIARRAARDASANARYGLACATLTVLLAIPFVTWWSMQTAAPMQAHRYTAVQTAPTAAGPMGLSVPVAYPASHSDEFSSAFLRSVVAIWLAGAAALWIRLLGGWAVALRMRSTRVRPGPAEWHARLKQLGSRMGVSRPVGLLSSAMVQAPVVIGWLRPIVLVPVGALAGMPPEQVEALLIHELAHIRRHDYLVNILQSIVEALLFYHPAVWWISGHIREERELCCDDLAVSLSGDVLTYARALVELEGFRPAHVSAAVSANGGSLAQRIGRLLGQPRPASCTLSGTGVIVSGIVLLVSACAVFGQDAAPRFEVASIKPKGDPSANTFFRGIRPLPNGRLTAVNATLQMLILNAYRVQPYQLIGAPGWAESEGFDIEAKGDARANQAQVLLMLRSLLEDRFQLRFHRESREAPVYALTVGKNGPKLAAPKEGGCVSSDPNSRISPPPPGPGPVTPCGSVNIGMATSGLSMNGGQVRMSEFVRTLQIVVGRPVIDRTGITAPFDVSLAFARDEVASGIPRPQGPMRPEPVDPGAGPASILTVIQQQLGLKLESTKGPVEVMVIDRVERPSAN